MPDPRAVHEAIEELFGSDLLVDVTYREPVTEIRAEVGIFGGRVWQIEFDVDGNDPSLTEPRFTAARPAGHLEFVPVADGEAAPERVVRHAHRMMEALRAAEHTFKEPDSPAPSM